MYEVFATDEDEGVNGEVRYSFLQTGAGNRDWENFRIDALTGVITTAVKLDREKQALYSVSSAWPLTNVLMHLKMQMGGMGALEHVHMTIIMSLFFV